MGENLDDLLPLFLSEAEERLERLAQAVSTGEMTPESAVAAKRELHALKGATRMMGMLDLSELCHRAEDVLDPLTPESKNLLIPMLDQLTVAVLELGRGDAERSSDRDEGAPADLADPVDEAEKVAPVSPVTSSADELRVPAKTLAHLSDRSVRCRVVASAGATIVDSLFRLAGFAEKAVNDKQPEQVLASLANSLREVAVELDNHQRAILMTTDHQLDTLLALQVQPIKPYLLGLARHARDLAQNLGKEVEVRVEADAGQLDRRIIDALKEAFLHLVRNSIDHGIESVAEREQVGKVKRGLLLLRASTEGDRVNIVVEDDGAGMDPVEIVRGAIEAGMIEAEDADRLTPAEQLQLICLPGFSTRQEATNVSGRGIGMEAVAEAVRSVGGDIVIESRFGRGSTIRLRIPLTRRGENLLVFRAGGAHVAIPNSVVRSYRWVGSNEIMSENDRYMVDLGERIVVVRVFDEKKERSSGAILIEGEVGGSNLALLVDDVVGEEEVFLRPVVSGLGCPRIFESVAVLASGRAVPVLSPQRLLVAESVLQDRSEIDQIRQVLKVLLVDDSQVTREMIRRLLEDGGFDVRATSSADEALRVLAQDDVDCIVTDIEMPEMDGLELTRHLRDTPQYAHLPIIVVSTRDHPQDRLAGLEAGADAYLTKQGLEARNLIGLVSRVGGV